MSNRDKTSVNTKTNIFLGIYGQESVIYQDPEYAKRAVHSGVTYTTFPTAVLAGYQLAPKQNDHKPQTTLGDMLNARLCDV